MRTTERGSVFEYEEEIVDFAKTLEAFIDQHELPLEWFGVPDHLAIKCADGTDYDYRLEELMIDASAGSQVALDGRRLGALQLISPQPVGQLGSVGWLEIMEPRPEKVGDDVVGLEHVEFYYPDFAEIAELLDARGVAYTEQSNPGHTWINIVLNEAGQELKLNNRLLADVVAEELADGTAHSLLA